MAHDHNHNPKSYNRAFAIGVVLNTAFVIIEAGYGIAADSMALIADAGHNLSDVISLLLAWGASYLATKKPTQTRTYGFRSVTIMASLTSAVMLLVALGGIAWEAFGRFANPQTVDAKTVIAVAAVGVVINTATALLFISGQKHDLNIRAAYLHMAADAGVSLGVVVVGIAIMMTGWFWIDPAISIAIVLLILIGTWGLLKDSLILSIGAVPKGVDIAAITAYLKNIDNVCEIHDLHVWALSTTENALTVHLVTTDGLVDNVFLHEVQKRLHDNFGIEHATIQVENETNENNCRLKRHVCI